MVLLLQMVSSNRLRSKEQVHRQLSQSNRLLTFPEANTSTVLQRSAELSFSLGGLACARHPMLADHLTSPRVQASLSDSSLRTCSLIHESNRGYDYRILFEHCLITEQKQLMHLHVSFIGKKAMAPGALKRSRPTQT